MLYIIIFYIAAITLYFTLPEHFSLSFHKGARNYIILESSNGFLLREPICLDTNGQKRIQIPNLLDKERQSFDGKLKDALYLAQRGYLDEIIINGDPREYCTIIAYRYLDRDYGEKMRKMTLRCWRYRRFDTVVFAMGDPAVFNYGWPVDQLGRAAVNTRQKERHFLTEKGARLWAKKKGLSLIRVGQVMRGS